MQIKKSVIIPGDWTIPGNAFMIHATGWVSTTNGVILPFLSTTEWPSVSAFSIKPDCMIRVVELIEQMFVDEYVNAKLNFCDYANHD